MAHFLFIMLSFAEQGIPKDAGDADFVGVQAPSHTPLGVVG